MNGQFDFGGITPTHYFFFIAVVLGLLFAFVSSEQDQAILLLLLQWQAQTLIPIALLVLVHMGLLKLELFARLSPWVSLSISGVIGASLFSPVALVLDLWVEAEAGVFTVSELIEEWLGLMPPIAVSWVAINAPWVLGYKVEKLPKPDRMADEPEAPEEVELPDFMSLVEPDKAGTILYMKSELHYLMVVTNSGKSLILYNLTDAVDQLSETAGMLVHRSYWVAFDAVAELTKKGRQGELRLTDGAAIPVSRNRLQEVRVKLGEFKL